MTNEITKEKLYRLRIEKFGDDKKNATSTSSQSLIEKYVFTGEDINKTRYLFDDSSANVLSVYRQLITPFLNDSLNYACNQTLAASKQQHLNIGSIELKKLLFQRSMLDRSSGLMEANMAEFLNYIWRETMGDLQELFGKEFQLSQFTLEKV